MLGQCLKLTDITTDQMGPGTWNAAAGTYTTTLPAHGSCGGSSAPGIGSDGSQLHLRANACGSLRFTVVSAQGYTASFGVAASLGVNWSGGVPIFMFGPGGGPDDPCNVASMTGGSVCTIPVACGTDIFIIFDRAWNGADMAAITATVLVEVL